MDLSKILLYTAIAIAGTIVTAACVRLIWLAIGGSAGIRVEDARWLHRYLGRITDQQLRDALTRSNRRTGGRE